MYQKFANVADNKGRQLKHFHHVTLDTKFKSDCAVWQMFLENASSVSLTRPFLDFNDGGANSFNAELLSFFTDASANPELGFSCYFNGRWTYSQWESAFIHDNDPSIEYLELFALCIGIFTWGHLLHDLRVVVHCDNQAVMHMVNQGVSSCRNCMYLLRMLTLKNLLWNRRIFVQYISSKNNYLADFLSRIQIRYFLESAPKENLRPEPDRLPTELWPMSRIWQQ